MSRAKKEHSDEVETLRTQVAHLERKLEEIQNAGGQKSQFEEALHESEEKYRTLIQTIPDIVYIIDQDGIFTFVNDGIEQLGYKPEELIGKHFSIILHKDDVEAVSLSSVLKKYKGKVTGDKDAPKLFDQRRTRSRKTSNLEVRIIPKDHQDTRDTLLNVVTEVNASGYYRGSVDSSEKQFLGTIGVIRDITQRKKQEEAQRESEEMLKGILDAISDHICMMDKNLNIIWANETFRKVFGKSVIGKRCHEVIKGKGKACESGECIAALAFKDNMVHDKLMKIVNDEGDVLHFTCTANVALRDKEGNPMTVVYILRDITELKRSEDEKRASQEFTRNIIDSSIDMIIAVDSDRRIVEFNRAAQETFGYSAEEVLGKNVQVLYADFDEGKDVHRKVREIGRFRREIRNRRKNGEVFPALISSSILHDEDGEFVGVMGVSRDITELKMMELELLKTQKLESLGILTGGIAHDFNNILTGILGNVSLAQYAKSLSDAKKRLKEAEKAALKARDLVKQLLTFSKGGAPIKKTASIKELIRDLVAFALRGSKVRSEFTLQENLWPLEVDEGQMNQVLNSMVINAIQAMPSGGILQVVGENVNLREEEISRLYAGQYVKISIIDSGVGIPEERLLKIFDPYYSTKEMGSGLGLATSYSIVKNHGGTITVDSRMGEGTTFCIYLPASPRATVILDDNAIVCPSGGGRVLIVDDEEPIRETLGEMLKELGYIPGYAAEGEEAIRLYKKEKECGQPFDAVIMDLTIPGGLGGKECIELLRSYDKDAKAIVSSGYSNDPVMSNYKAYGFCDFITKPYRMEELSRVLDRVVFNIK